MLKNNIELDVKTKCIESGITQAKLAADIETSAPYVNRVIKNKETIVNKTFINMREVLGYDIRLMCEKRDASDTADNV